MLNDPLGQYPHGPGTLPPPSAPCCRRLKAHMSPFNSGLLAGEALTAPFFGAPEGRVEHATLPVSVSRAFPLGA